jgi:hypothetical protein
MKKVVILSAAFLISLSAAFAGNGGTSIHSLIHDQIKVPSELKNQKLNEKVTVQLRISNNGKVSVLDVNTNNPELKNYVTRKLSDIDFSITEDKKETTYFIDINFRVL